MKIISKETGVQKFYIYRGQPLIVKQNSLSYNNSVFNIADNESYYVENNVFTKHVEECDYVFINNEFHKVNKEYNDIYFFSDASWIEFSRENNTYYARLVEGEYYYNLILNDSKNYECRWLHNDILVFNQVLRNFLLFYAKTGERLWEYKTENSDWKINRMCIPMVDDVVVIISTSNPASNYRVRIEGFNIHTGERLWINNHKNITNHYFIGPDKMLYTCQHDWLDMKNDIMQLVLYKLNPFTGETETTQLKVDDDRGVVCPWNTCIYGNKLYYADNHPGCILGVVDIDKKQIVEEFSLNLKKGFRMGAPIVTEDKIYQFIRNKKEVWVFDK